MKLLLGLGVGIAMTACTTPPTAGTDRDNPDPARIQPSPVQVPAEVDPPPPVQPGYESPGLEPSDPVQTPEPQRSE